MKTIGKKSIGSILKVILQIFFILGILALFLLPVVLFLGEIPFEISFPLWILVPIIYPNAICLLGIAYQFIGLFRSLKEENPFCDNTVKRLKIAGGIAAANAIIWILTGVYLIKILERIGKEADLTVIIFTGFMTILFIGVAIALVILSELFKQACEYKKENDLTV